MEFGCTVKFENYWLRIETISISDLGDTKVIESGSKILSTV